MTNLVLADVVSVPAGGNDDVLEGSTIKAVYIEMWIQSDAVTKGTATLTFEKKPAGVAVMTAAQSADLNDYVNKRNVFEIHMGLTPDLASNPVPFFKGWYKIPKGKQRMALGDRLMLNVNGITTGAVGCGFALYKEYQ